MFCLTTSHNLIKLIYLFTNFQLLVHKYKKKKTLNRVNGIQIANKTLTNLIRECIHFVLYLDVRIMSNCQWVQLQKTG